MSRRRMVFVGMTILSAVGFMVDRLLLGEPAPAAAAATDVPAARSSRKPAAAPAEPKQDPVLVAADPSLAYLERLGPSGPGRDIFSMSSEMLRYYKSLEQQEEERAAREGPQPGSPEEFQGKHTLDGTYHGPTGPLAVIDGEVRRPGDLIDEFRITRIDSYGVELRRGRDRVVLELPQPGAGGRDAAKEAGSRKLRKPSSR